jgi:transcription elongation factor GreA
MFEQGGAMTGTGEIWLTEDAFARLKTELDDLVAQRPAMAAEINARREEGDLKENGGYHAARDEQVKQEARIRQLQELLRNAQVGVPPADDGVIEPGMVVTVAYDGDDDDQETFLLGSREEGSHGSMQVYSPQSPLGQAILGASKGESREYVLPSGKTQKVSIIDAKPYGA